MNENSRPFRRLGVMLDCSRNAVMNVPTLKAWMDTIADLGYNTLMLYTEDTYEVDNQPYFGYLRGRYSKEELREIDDYAWEKGLEFIPAIQTLAHLNAIFHWPGYGPICDCNDILLAGDDRTYQLIEDIFATLEKTVRTRTVNIGMDEAHMLGRGQYQDIHGFEDRFDILLEHLKKVAAIAKRHGFECIMWGDMFFRLLGSGYHSDAAVPARVKDMIPDNVNLIYWDYYSTDRERYSKQIASHSAVKDGVWFAGGLWCWSGFAPHNGYSIAATTAAFDACVEHGVQDVFLTMWGDNGAECSRFTLLPSLYYAARLADGCCDEAEIKRGFLEKYGIPFDDFMAVDLPGTPNAVENETYDPEKYLLYNDCFLGQLDSTVRDGDAARYGECVEKLRAQEDHPTYGYLFKTMRTLCEVLSLKVDIGIRTRAAYASGDKAAVAALLPDYDRILERLEAFYRAFREQWMQENKPNGFEVQDIRIGGLHRRILHCRERLAAYVEGQLFSIEELEEPLLDFTGGEHTFHQGPIGMNDWARAASVCPL